MHKSESLLGRAVTLEVSGFDISETGATAKNMETLWLRGGFPAAYLAPDDAISTQWRHAAIQRHISGDLSLLGMNASAPLMTRFWQMLAYYHGQTARVKNGGAHMVAGTHRRVANPCKCPAN
ncbi:hypothetical protein [Limnohabitans sp.]|jgi:predicted AAA+ superfamily ATPase|uniref:hypothetical protein n=1 Tax=Limnohabitans sp. TaxID=1907725 RepID=UPI0037C015CB